MEGFSEIRQRTDALLQRRNIPRHPYLPLLEPGGIRAADEVADKIISLYCLAGLANGADAAMLLEWLTEADGLESLDAKDRDVLECANICERLMNELSWKQESLYTLCWASGLIKEIQWPKKECDLSKAFSKIPPEVPINQFRRSLTLRPSITLNETLDVYCNLHASLMHPELWNGRNPTEALKIEVVLERRQALEWVCSDSLDWDEISLDT